MKREGKMGHPRTVRCIRASRKRERRKRNEGKRGRTVGGGSAEREEGGKGGCSDPIKRGVLFAARCIVGTTISVTIPSRQVRGEVLDASQETPQTRRNHPATPSGSREPPPTPCSTVVERA